MTRDKFIRELNDAYSTSNKLIAVKLIFDTKAINGGLKGSKEFIDEHWYPTNKKSVGLNIWNSLSIDQKTKVKIYDNSN